jgi:glycosyltransferase involved in cell wall biosynthesis
MNKNKTIDVLVFSAACHTAINRKVFSDIMQAGKTVVIAIPSELKFGSKVVRADMPKEGDPDIRFLKLNGYNARTNYFGGVFKIIRKYNPKNIVIDNDPASIMVLQVAIFSKLINQAKLFCISYENLSIAFLDSFSRRGFKSIIPYIYKKTFIFVNKKMISGVFVVSNEGYKVFKSEGIKNVCKIPLGFDSNYFNIDNESRVEIRRHLEVNNKFTIGYFGRVSYEKGVHVLVEALSTLLKYDWVLLIDKFDRYQNHYANFIYDQIDNVGISERVIYSSPSHNEIGKFMNAVDVVVMPSLSTPQWVEQYGRVAPEAMACGKIVIASNTGAIPMLLNGYGILVDEENSIELARKLEDIIIGGNGGLLSTPQEISNYAHNSLNTIKQSSDMLNFMDSI